jgi:hypothetical protein
MTARSLRLSGLLAAAGLAASVGNGAFSPAALAQSPSSSTAQTPAAAQPEAAVEKFTKVLNGGNVPAPLMAKTLLQRGTAYRQEGKPAQAVADLTSAMYLKNGLSEPERADATAQRSAAYREAGLSEQGVTAADRAAAPPAKTASAFPSMGWPAAAASPAAMAPPSLASAAEVPAAPAKSGGFFSSLFGSGETAAPPPAPPAPAPQRPAVSAWAGPEDAAKTGAAPVRAGTKAGTKVASAGAPELLPWERPAGEDTSAAPAVPVKSARAAGQPVPKTAAATAGKPAGRLRLQLAAVMNKAEAQTIANRVKSEFGADIGSRTASIDEAPLGSATMYIVRFGPYATTAEIKALCTRIRATGTDCLQAP